MKILILTADSNGAYPVPASRDGAISLLVEHLLDENNKKLLCDMEVVSFYDGNAFLLASKYTNIKFHWIKVPIYIKLLDKLLFNIVRILNRGAKCISFKSLFSLIYYIWKVRKIVNTTNANKIILENNLLLTYAIKNTKYKGEWYYHLHNIPRLKVYDKQVINKTTKFLCVSKYVAQQICSDKSVLKNIPIEKTEVFYNCVDTDLFSPIDKTNDKIKLFKAQYSINPKDIILLFVGRMTNEKGADILIRILNKLPSCYKALIVGSYHYNINIKNKFQNELKNLARQSSNRVIFTGYIPHTELPYIYNLADISVLLSLWDEPAGLTNIESMACGTVIATTNSGGIKEYVGDYLIFERDNYLIDETANFIKEIIYKNALRQKLQNYCIKHARDFFSKDYYLEKLISILR
jgi:glycosyltransferase involved in cell wall biosynthesis